MDSNFNNTNDFEPQLEWDSMEDDFSSKEDISLDSLDEENQNRTEILLYSIYKSFENEESLNSSLKKKFSNFILGILLALTSVISIVVIFQGFSLIHLEEWTLRIFVSGIFIEIVALINIMVTSLFPKDDRKIYLDFIKEFAVYKNKIL